MMSFKLEDEVSLGRVTLAKTPSELLSLFLCHGTFILLIGNVWRHPLCRHLLSRGHLFLVPDENSVLLFVQRLAVNRHRENYSSFERMISPPDDPPLERNRHQL